MVRFQKLHEGATPDETHVIYNRFYQGGGWAAPDDREQLKAVVAAPAGWSPGARLLELGCGMGHHARLLHELGFQVTAVDASDVGIEKAKENRGPQYICADVRTFTPEGTFDGIFSRGLSFFHYELDGPNKHGINVVEQTARMFQWLRPGGTFALQISSDFSGRRPTTWIHHNRRSDYVGLFERFGEVVGVSDWKGVSLTSDEQAQRRGQQRKSRGVVIVTRKQS